MDEMREEKSGSASALHADVAYERRDVSARVIAWVGLGIVISAIILHLVVGWLYGFLNANAMSSGRRPASLVGAPQSEPPEPRLQARPLEDLRRLRAAEEEKLNGYGWVDRDQGITRISIERAMQLIAKRGIQAAASQQATNTNAGQGNGNEQTVSAARAGQGRKRK